MPFTGVWPLTHLAVTSRYSSQVMHMHLQKRSLHTHSFPGALPRQCGCPPFPVSSGEPEPEPVTLSLEDRQRQ